jgi:hypothetical protein
MGLTKVCTHGRDAALAMQMLEQSLKRLQTDRFDLWQIHGVTFDNDPEMFIRPGGENYPSNSPVHRFPSAPINNNERCENGRYKSAAAVASPICCMHKNGVNAHISSSASRNGKSFLNLLFNPSYRKAIAVSKYSRTGIPIAAVTTKSINTPNA